MPLEYTYHTLKRRRRNQIIGVDEDSEAFVHMR